MTFCQAYHDVVQARACGVRLSMWVFRTAGNRNWTRMIGPHAWDLADRYKTAVFKGADWVTDRIMRDRASA